MFFTCDDFGSCASQSSPERGFPEDAFSSSIRAGGGQTGRERGAKARPFWGQEKQLSPGPGRGWSRCPGDQPSPLWIPAVPHFITSPHMPRPAEALLRDSLSSTWRPFSCKDCVSHPTFGVKITEEKSERLQ